MAIKLSDCPPSLHAAIMAQLAKEGREFPATPVVKYAVAHQMGGKWSVGPETANLKLVTTIVSRLQLQSARSAHLASIGKPTAVVLKITTNQGNQT